MKNVSLFLVCVFSFVCCGHYVLVPPEIDLIPYERVGLIAFAVEDAEGQLDSLATQLFLQELLYSQRGAQIIELGNLDDVLSEIDETKLDLDAAASIGERFGVSTYLFGSVQVSDVKPKVDIIGLVQGGRVQAVFDMSITARMISTETGATLWTDSVLREGNLAYMSMTRGGVPYFDVKDKQNEVIRMVEDMIHDLTRDFRPSKQRMR